MRFPLLLRSVLLLALALVAGALVVPATSVPAAAVPGVPGTLVYLKGYNVYVARPDGSGERRLTSGGTARNPWRSPSQSDAGHVVTARGGVVYRMDQWGTVLNTFDPPDLTDSADQRVGGAVTHVVVSPDGSKIAYTFQHFVCPPDAPCRMRWVSAVSAASHFTPASAYGVAYHENPSWVTGGRLILNGVSYDSIHLFDLALRTQFWFHDAQPTNDFHPLFEPVLSRDGTRFSAVRGEGEEAHLITAEVRGNARSGPRPTWPTYECRLGGGASVASPTFAPDGSALAWSQAEGVIVKTALDDCEVQPEVAIAGAVSPHWSSAGLQSVRPVYRFALRAAPSIKAPRGTRRGAKLRATSGTWSPTPAAVGYQWLRNGRVIRGATAATYKVKKADRRKRISVRVSVRRAPYTGATATSRTVKIRR